MSTFSEAQGRWLLSFVLNSGLIVTMDDATRRTLYNFLRRAELAFREYEAASRATAAYIANPNPDAVSEYIVAIGHWESFLAQAYQAWCLLARGQKILFQPRDGSVMQRLHLLYNRSKHAESAITSQQLPPDGTLPVWLENDGLHRVEAALTFSEMADVLEDLARFADGAQSPITMREAVMAAYAQSPITMREAVMAAYADRDSA